jgi:predicted TIM-barrel fold metal-dependent hydrolase
LITDAQVHIWEVDRPDRPWPKPLRNQPQLPNGFEAEEMIAQMDAASVDRAVIVPPTWIGENNSTAIEASEAYPGRFAIMGRFDPMRPDMEEALAGWLEQPHMLGIRMTFRVPPYDTWLGENAGAIEPYWTACERNNIPVMCLAPDEAHKLAPIAERHPGLRLIVDHMAANLAAKGDEAFAHIDGLLGLAKFDNVSVKTSSAPCFSADPFPYADIYPYLKQIYEAFGSHRMLWGADYTRLTSTYPECLRHFQEGLDFLTAEDKEWVLGKSAAEILNWPEQS